MVFRELEVVYISLLLFPFYCLYQIKQSSLAKIWGAAAPQPSPPTGFYGPVKHFPFSRYSNSEKNLEKKGEVSLKIYGVGTGQQTISIDILPNIS